MEAIVHENDNNGAEAVRSLLEREAKSGPVSLSELVANPSYENAYRIYRQNAAAATNAL